MNTTDARHILKEITLIGADHSGPEGYGSPVIALIERAYKGKIDTLTNALAGLRDGADRQVTIGLDDSISPHVVLKIKHLGNGVYAWSLTDSSGVFQSFVETVKPFLTTAFGEEMPL